MRMRLLKPQFHGGMPRRTGSIVTVTATLAEKYKASGIAEVVQEEPILPTLKQKKLRQAKKPRQN